VSDGLQWVECLGRRATADHVATMTGRLLDALHALGDRVEIYGPQEAADRGGVVAFNVRRDGRVLPYEQVEAAAHGQRVAIRAGCFCNPGAAEHAFQIDAARARACYNRPFSIARFRACLDGRPVGAVRASVGIATTPGDIERLYRCLDGL
jgi:selenocysteine lyase/cysteine desulfurase